MSYYVEKRFATELYSQWAPIDIAHDSSPVIITWYSFKSQRVCDYSFINHCNGNLISFTLPHTEVIIASCLLFCPIEAYITISVPSLRNILI